MPEEKELPKQKDQQAPPPDSEVGPWRYRVFYPVAGGGERSYLATPVPDSGDPDVVWRQQLASRRILKGLRPDQVRVVREGEANASDRARIRQAFGTHAVKTAGGAMVSPAALPGRTRDQMQAAAAAKATQPVLSDGAK